MDLKCLLSFHVFYLLKKKILELTFSLYFSAETPETKPEKAQLSIDVRTALTESSSSG